MVIIPELLDCIGHKMSASKELINTTAIFTDEYKKLPRHTEDWRRAFLGKLGEYVTEIYFNDKYGKFFTETKFENNLYGDGGIDKTCLKYSLTIDDKAFLTRPNKDRKDQFVFFPDKFFNNKPRKLSADIYQMTEINVGINEDCSIKTNPDGSIDCYYMGYLTKDEVELLCEPSAYKRNIRIDKMEEAIAQKQKAHLSV